FSVSVPVHHPALHSFPTRRSSDHRELIARLRKAYGDYWQAQRLEVLAQGYLQDEPTFEHVAALRTRAGLLLEADRLELLTGFSLDRKSTRLNSSHRTISYAVFCLK